MTEGRRGPFRPAKILRTLAEHEVAYVLIGGLAVAAHGAPRGTFDVDIIPAPEPENWERLAAALSELGPPELVQDSDFRSLDPTDPFDLARSKHIAIRTDAGRIDVLNRLRAAGPYDDLRAKAMLTEVVGVEVRVVDLDTLIRLKREAGRDQDLRDIAELTALDTDTE